MIRLLDTVFPAALNCVLAQTLRKRKTGNPGFLLIYGVFLILPALFGMPLYTAFSALIPGFLYFRSMGDKTSDGLIHALFTCLLCITAMIFMRKSASLFYTGYESKVTEEYYLFLTGIINLLSLCAAILFMRYYQLHRQYIGRNETVIMTVFAAILFCLVTYIEGSLYADVFNRETASILLLAAGFTAAFFFYRVRAQQIIYRNLRSSEKEIRNQTIIRAKAEEELHRLRHDLKHFMSVLERELPEMSAALKEETGKLKQESEQQKVYIRTPSMPLSYVLNVKKEEALKAGLRFQVFVNMSSDIDMETDDLYLLMSNLLDNAIVHNCRNGEIIIHITEKEEGIFFMIRNTAGLEKETNDGIHGFGLPACEEITERYGGLISSYVNGINYTVRMLLKKKKRAETL